MQPFEQLGTYDPMPNKDGQILLSLNLERIRYWIGRGALFTDNMQELMGKWIDSLLVCVGRSFGCSLGY